MVQPSSHNQSTQSDHIPWFDWLRFLAALAVVLSHTHSTIIIPWSAMAPVEKTVLAVVVFSLCSFGQEAVVIFFVLSGMLVGGRLIERLRDDTFDLWRYAIDRITRIYVPLLPAIALAVLVWVSVGNPLNVLQVLGNIVQLQGIACDKFPGNRVLWSLAYEFWFYVMAGAVGVLFTRRQTPRFAPLLLLFGCLALFAKLDPAYLFCWLIGALAYAFRAQIPTAKAAILGPVLLLAGIVLSSPVGITERDGVIYRANFLLISSGFAMSAVVISRIRPSGVARKIDSLGSRLASGSYTLFLTHAPVIAIFRHLNPTPNTGLSLKTAIDAAVCLGVCFLVAWIFYHLFEKHTGTVRGFIGQYWKPTTIKRS
jgi:peptidoglycan/LPS O-acetylase OafA/YrhL